MTFRSIPVQLRCRRSRLRNSPPLAVATGWLFLWWERSMEPQTGALAKSTTDRRQRDTGRVMPRENVEIVRQPIAVLTARAVVWMSASPCASHALSRCWLERLGGSTCCCHRARGCDRRSSAATSSVASRPSTAETSRLPSCSTTRTSSRSFDQRLVALCFEPVYRGREARIEAQRRWIVEWGEERTEPEELIDLGYGRLLLLVGNTGKGPSSGAVVERNLPLHVVRRAGDLRAAVPRPQ